MGKEFEEEDDEEHKRKKRSADDGDGADEDEVRDVFLMMRMVVVLVQLVGVQSHFEPNNLGGGKKIKSISNFLVGSDTRVDNPTSQPDDQRQAGTSCSELSDCQKTVTNIKCAWWWCVCLFGQTQLLVVDKDLIEFFYHHTISGNEERPKEKLDSTSKLISTFTLPFVQSSTFSCTFCKMYHLFLPKNILRKTFLKAFMNLPETVCILL